MWPFVPQRGFTESLEWSTDVMRNKGQEQRLSLRSVPRQGHEYVHLLDEQQLARANTFTRALRHEQVLVPSWEWSTYVGTVASGADAIAFSTAYAPFRVGDKVAVWQEHDHFEVKTVEALSSSGIGFESDPISRPFSHALVMPVRASYFDQDPEVTRGTNPLSQLQARFITTEYVPLAGLAASPGYPTYRGHEVVTDRTVLLSSLTERSVREASSFDNETGLLWLGADYTYPINTSSIAWAADDRQALWNLRCWLDRRRGRWSGFWKPSWNLDFVLASTVASDAVTMLVRDVGFRVGPGTGDIMVEMIDGSRIFRQITGVEAGPAGTERLTLATSPGTALTLSNVAAISLMSFMRLDADRVEIKHRAARGADVAIVVSEAPLP